MSTSIPPRTSQTNPEEAKKSFREERRNSKMIDAQLKKDKVAFEQELLEPRILILGTSDSGKSTLLKQLRILHGVPFTPEEVVNFKVTMHQNILSSSCNIVQYCTENDVWPSDEERIKFEPLLDYDNDATEIDYATQKLISNLWKQVYVKSAYDTKQFLIQDTAAYLLSRVDTLCDPTYKLKNENILHIRVVTRKIQETVFMIENQRFHFFDVSGQRNERKYWVPYFDNVHTILFVVSIASYDQMTEEVPSINRMIDAMDLFKEICSNALLAKVRKIVFLNKNDLFKKKIKINLVRKYLPEAPNSTAFSELIQYFQEAFKTTSGNRSLTIHTTCCTDSTMMEVIVSEVVKGLLTRLLQGTGFAV